MNGDVAIPIAIAIILAAFIGGVIGLDIYAKHMRQECIVANAARPAVDVVAICKP